MDIIIVAAVWTAAGSMLGYALNRVACEVKCRIDDKTRRTESWTLVTQASERSSSERSRR
jgi:hypothetical protein